MQGELKRKSICTIFVTFSGDKFHGAFLINPWGIRENRWKHTSQTGLFIYYSSGFQKNGNVWEIILVIWRWNFYNLCYGRLFKTRRIGWRDLWIGYYHYSMDIVCNEILIEFRIIQRRGRWSLENVFHEEEHSLQVAWDPVSPCRDSLPPACTQICK